MIQDQKSPRHKVIIINHPIKGEQFAGDWIDGVLFRHVDSTKHKMRKYDAYGFLEGALADLKELGTDKILIIETDTGIWLESKLEKWFSKDVVVDSPSKGDGLQRFLPCKKMKKINHMGSNRKSK